MKFTLLKSISVIFNEELERCPCPLGRPRDTMATDGCIVLDPLSACRDHVWEGMTPPGPVHVASRCLRSRTCSV